MKGERRDRKLVVAGLIVEGDKVLLTRRKASGTMPGKWEFPGGKMEEGETPQQALHRELDEELGVRVLVGRIFEVVSHVYEEFDLLMLVYPCRLLGKGRPKLIEVADMVWVTPARMQGYDMLAADVPLVKRLASEEILEIVGALS